MESGFCGMATNDYNWQKASRPIKRALYLTETLISSGAHSLSQRLSPMKPCVPPRALSESHAIALLAAAWEIYSHAHY